MEHKMPARHLPRLNSTYLQLYEAEQMLNRLETAPNNTHVLHEAIHEGNVYLPKESVKVALESAILFYTKELSDNGVTLE